MQYLAIPCSTKQILYSTIQSHAIPNSDLKHEHELCCKKTGQGVTGSACESSPHTWNTILPFLCICVFVGISICICVLYTTTVWLFCASCKLFPTLSSFFTRTGQNNEPAYRSVEWRPQVTPWTQAKDLSPWKSLHPHHCLSNQIDQPTLCKMGKMASMSKSWWLSSQGSFRVTIRSQIAGHRCTENQSQSHTLRSCKSCLQPLQWQKVKVVTKKSQDRLQRKFSWKMAHASASQTSRESTNLHWIKTQTFKIYSKTKCNFQPQQRKQLCLSVF